MIVGNFYTPLRGLLENAVTAGFVAPQNLALCQIVDLPGGSAANLDESRAGEWGEATIKALKEWSLDVSISLRRPLVQAASRARIHTLMRIELIAAESWIRSRLEARGQRRRDIRTDLILLRTLSFFASRYLVVMDLEYPHTILHSRMQCVGVNNRTLHSHCSQRCDTRVLRLDRLRGRISLY